MGRMQPWEPDPLSPAQEELFKKVWAELMALPGIQEKAAGAGWELDRNLVIKYCDAAHWEENQGTQIAKTIEHVLQWRCEFQVVSMHPSMFENIAKRCPIMLCGMDREGRPILYVDMYRARAENADLMLRYLVFHMERASAVYKSHESAEHRLAIIVDCSGTRPRATIPPEEKGGMSSSSAKDLSTVMQLYYAHSMGVCLILGAGFTITTTYKALSCIMPEETRNKVKFMSRSSAKAYLAKNVDPEVLISDLGGRFPYTTYDSQRYLYAFDVTNCIQMAEDVEIQEIESGFSFEAMQESVYYSTQDVLDHGAMYASQQPIAESSLPDDVAATQQRRASRVFRSSLNKVDAFAEQVKSSLKSTFVSKNMKGAKMELSQMAGRIRGSSWTKGLFEGTSLFSSASGERDEEEEAFYDCWEKPPGFQEGNETVSIEQQQSSECTIQ